jgi:hypothetical protein
MGAGLASSGGESLSSAITYYEVCLVTAVESGATLKSRFSLIAVPQLQFESLSAVLMGRANRRAALKETICERNLRRSDRSLSISSR